MTSSLPNCRLYLVSPRSFDIDNYTGILAQTLDAGDVAAYQLRMPDASPEQIRAACEALAPVAQERGVAFILNDHPEIAAETGCDGIHFDDPKAHIRDARNVIGEQGFIGVFCDHSRHVAMQAGERGADYVLFAPFFPEMDRIPAPDTELLTWWQEMIEIPCVAAGGITPSNCAPLVRAGADFLCAGTAIWDYDGGPAKAVAGFNDAITGSV